MRDSDSTNGGGGVRYPSHSSVGMWSSRMCSKCSKAKSQRGGRMVGPKMMKRWICAGCVAAADAAKAGGASA